MRHLLRALAAAFALAPALPALAAGAEPLALPSGRAVTFLDTIWGSPGPAGLTVRFRFVEPELPETLATLDYTTTEADMRYLCESYALDRIANTGPQPNQVIVSIADRPTAFGAVDPGATQVFEAYRRDGDQCIWEGF